MTPEQVFQTALELYGDPVEARIAAAQAQLETGGGASMPGNNLFGIKGPGGTYATTEIVNGQPVRTQASFRAYPDPRASIVDRLEFLRSNPRYAAAGYFDATTPEEKAEALQRAGYATDPNYAAKLKQIMSGEVTTMPISAFPQFSPAAFAETIAPVSGMAPMAGVLGSPPAGPLLGSPQPTSLLDMFAPGSGFGYDLAAGIAATPGGPLTALAGGMAHAKDRAFERQIADARLGSAGSKLPDNIREMLLLKQMHPNLTDEQIMSMAFTGRMPRGGRIPKQVGERFFWEEFDAWGNPTLTPLSAQEQAQYEEIIGSQAGAKSRGAEEAKQRVKNREAFRSRFMDGRSQIPSAIAKTQQLLAELRGGAYGTGAIVGPLRQRFDSAIQTLGYERIGQLLQLLSQVTTGALSEGELDLFMQGAIGPNKTVDANIAILEDQLRSLQSQYSMLEDMQTQWSNPDFDPLRYMPSLPPIEPLPTRFIGLQPQAPAQPQTGNAPGGQKMPPGYTLLP